MVELTSLSKIFLACICLKGLTESYLDKRNKFHILNHRNEVPEKFSSIISLEDHQKAADYSITKINVGNFFNFIGYIILVAWTLFGGLDLLNSWVLKFSLGPIATGVVFIGLKASLLEVCIFLVFNAGKIRQDSSLKFSCMHIATSAKSEFAIK